eukprot:1725660-Pyramimonas_sp.AAC.1
MPPGRLPGLPQTGPKITPRDLQGSPRQLPDDAALNRSGQITWASSLDGRAPSSLSWPSPSWPY